MRARNIKPGIFKNELLGEADPMVSLLFVGLWTIADREGRLEDRPMRIKGEIFPYRDGIDINGYLTELASLGFIERYEVAGSKFIQILNFKKHQSPHKTEKLSEIPSKSLIDISSRASSVNDEKITEALPSDLLIPDSLNHEATVVKTTNDSFESPVDFKKHIFTDCLKLVGGESKRSLVGKWLRDYGEEKVIAAFLACQRNSAVDPIPYIEKTMKEKSNANTGGNSSKFNKPSKTDRAKEAVYRAAQAGGFAPEPGGQSEVGEHALSVLPES